MNKFMDYFDYESATQQSSVTLAELKTDRNPSDDEVMEIDDACLREVMDIDTSIPQKPSIHDVNQIPKHSLQSTQLKKAFGVEGKGGKDESVDYYTNFTSVKELQTACLDEDMAIDDQDLASAM